MKNTQNSSTRGVGWVGHEAGILWGGWVGSNMGCRYKVAPVQQDGTQPQARTEHQLDQAPDARARR